MSWKKFLKSYFIYVKTIYQFLKKENHIFSSLDILGF